MIFLELLEIVIGALFLFFVITQILIPLAKGLPYFPAFRKSTEKLEEALEEAKEEVEKAGLEAMLEKERIKAEEIRKNIKLEMDRRNKMDPEKEKEEVKDAK